MMSSCWQITFLPLEPPSSEFENFLEEYFEVTACNYDDEGRDEYVGYHSGSFDESAMLAAAAQISLELPPYKTEKLESTNWLKDYVIRFSPFEAEDFIIYGIHETQAPDSTRIPLQIYAATAFGSDHQTTRSCIKALSELYHQGFSACNILDVGTGSGILSLAAAKLWQQQCRITAVDIDEESVLVTRSNAALNQVENCIDAAVSNGCQAPLVAQNAPYDLILANILARPLLEMASSFSQALRPGGFCILSGFVDDQCPWVISSYQQYGFQLIKLYELDNWRAALLQKV